MPCVFLNLSLITLRNLVIISSLAYGTVLTDVGRTQYAFLSVTVSESLRLHPASMAHSNEATWEQLSPRPAMQSQWADRTLPEFSHTTQGVRGFSDIL